MAILSIEANDEDETSRKQKKLVSWRLVHAKLGHIRKASIRRYFYSALAKHETILGLEEDMIDWNDNQACVICARANIKQHRLPRHSEMSELEPFKKGFVNLWTNQPNFYWRQSLCNNVL